MRVALVHPAGSNWVPGERDITSVANRMAPLGLLSIAAWLKREGHETAVFDGLGPDAPLDTGDRVREILGFAPQLVGFSATTSGFLDGYDVAVALKAAAPDVRIAFGGVHVSALGKALLERFSGIDYLCPGEGEVTMAELAAGRDPAAIDGLARGGEGTRLTRRAARPTVGQEGIMGKVVSGGTGWLVAAVAVVVLGCGGAEDDGTSCFPSACVSMCLAQHYLAGECRDGVCLCGGPPPLDADADADRDSGADADAEAEGADEAADVAEDSGEDETAETDAPWDPAGTYAISTGTLEPPVDYSCAFGAITLHVESLTFIDDGISLAVDGAPCRMLGASALPGGRMINVSCEQRTCFPADCSDQFCWATHSLTGSFTTDDQWSGTFSTSYRDTCLLAPALDWSSWLTFVESTG